ncbi:MAG TPA: helix-turn-helix domain-containing protein [Actinomycetes bacterium]|nr:helix-turn-helix domain-containing protein [Actinomycetes bacterium]
MPVSWRSSKPPHTTTELSRRLHVTPSAISQDLSALSDAGLIHSEHTGRRRLP